MQIDGQSIKVDELWGAAQGGVKVKLAEAAHERMQRSRSYIEKRLLAGDVIYGVNTGFGALSSVKIDHKDLMKLQKNLIRSHCVGIGPYFSIEESRAVMLLRANALARGHSGVRPEVVLKILEFFNSDFIAAIPQQGSVGASGDLAPLSHLALALIGEGQVWNEGQIKNFFDLSTPIKPLEPMAKEGLSLINGCQVMTAVGLLNLYRAKRLLWMADLAGAMSLEAIMGSRAAFDPLISASRPHEGEMKTASNLRILLGEISEISQSHVDCGRVQDAYSLRCMPAVHGVAKESVRMAWKVLETEANSSTDNPLVFTDDNKILSCGNFHGQPVSFAMDHVAIAMTSLASISERRLEKLMTPARSGGLPMFLTKNSGLESGFMIVQVAAASLVSENKGLSHPASVDSIPTNDDKEDHVSMGTIAARKLRSVIDNCENIFAMEILAATQGLDFRSPLKPSVAVGLAHQLVREHVPQREGDRNLSAEVQKVRTLIQNDEFQRRVFSKIGDLQW